ncbi:MAG: hypothetical protein IKB93_17085 [Clostridia bacterium]|nr:hypothetical protein [Clostridia bacterium]
MKYRGFYIDETETTDVLRPTETGSEKCDGIWFRLYADSDYGIQIDDFIGAYGHEIENSEESVEQFVKTYIDQYYAEYKEQQFRLLLETDYKDYVYDVKQFDEDFDIVEDAEEIANMKRAYECLKDFKGITLEEMEYLVTLKRPLETVCNYFSYDKEQFAKEFTECIKMVAQDQKNNYGLVTEYEDRDEMVIDDVEPEEDAGMTMQ